MNLMSEELDILKPPPLYAKQREAIFSPARYVVIEASTKSGKTAGCIVWILTEAWDKGKPGRNWWWVAPIFPQSKIAFSRMQRMLLRCDPKKSVWRSNESELWIELKNGGRIWFKSADDPDSLYGEDVHGAVIDEATRCKEQAWFAIRSTLTATNGPLRIIGNVKGRKNWAYKLGLMAKSGEPDMAYAKLTAQDAVDAGVLDAAEVEDARRKLPDAVFRELYLAEPSDDGGNPFGLQHIAGCFGVKSDMPPVIWGVDLAKSVDWTWAIALDAEGRQCASERWQGPWDLTASKLAAMIGHTPAVVDSTGVGDPVVERLQKSCPRMEGFKFTSQSKQQLMEGLAVALQQRTVTYHDEMLRNELETYEYEYTRSGVRYTAPEGLHDDGVCALALSVRGFTTAANRLPASATFIEPAQDEGMWQDITEGWN